MDNSGSGQRRRRAQGAGTRQRQLFPGFPVSRGRPRKYNPDIPDHIDQRKLPKGAYWDPRDSYCYPLLPDSAKRRKRLAGATATLAALHRILADLVAGNRGSIEWLDSEFRQSDQYKALSEATRRDYGACLRVLQRTRDKQGNPVASLTVDRITAPYLQVLIDKLAVKTPAMANHVKRYLGRLFRWGMARGKCAKRENPAHGLDPARESKQFKMPSRAVMARAIAFARERGALPARSKGSCPAYLWIVMVIAYRCRLRGIEVLTMTEDAMTAPNSAGHCTLLAKRRKGSKTNRVQVYHDLMDAWSAGLRHRDAVWRRTSYAVPMRPADRLVLVSGSGEAISGSTWANAWKRFMALAIREGILEPGDYFTLHGLKHRGITDSANPADGGHATDRMRNLYDHDIPLTEPAGQ